MATDLRGLFENNRRRETNAVTVSFPFNLGDADLRSGTPEKVMESGEYVGFTLPGGVIVTNAYLVVTDAFDGAGSSIKVDIDTTNIIPALTDITTEGLTISAVTDMLVVEPVDVKATMVIDGSGTKGVAEVVIEYIDYKRATMSYIGEE